MECALPRSFRVQGLGHPLPSGPGTVQPPRGAEVVLGGLKFLMSEVPL